MALVIQWQFAQTEGSQCWEWKLDSLWKSWKKVTEQVIRMCLMAWVLWAQAKSSGRPGLHIPPLLSLQLFPPPSPVPGWPRLGSWFHLSQSRVPAAPWDSLTACAGKYGCNRVYGPALGESRQTTASRSWGRDGLSYTLHLLSRPLEPGVFQDYWFLESFR